VHWGGYNANAEPGPPAGAVFNGLCVFNTAVPITKLFAWGEGDTKRVCVFITAVPIIKLFA
jgi:hypothetical protein